MPDKTIHEIFVKICRAVEFMHSKNLVHRDIKPENILMNEDLEPKLCDFGWSIELNKNESRQTFCGTYEYMAPEIFETENYNSAVDVWSLGVLLYELIHGKSPFFGSSIFNIYKNIIKEQITFKKGVDPQARALIRSILKINPIERPSVQKILAHPYVANFGERTSEGEVRLEIHEEDFPATQTSNPRSKIESLVFSTKKNSGKIKASIFELGNNKSEIFLKEDKHPYKNKNKFTQSFQYNIGASNKLSKLMNRPKLNSESFRRNDSDVKHYTLAASPMTLTPRCNEVTKKRFFPDKSKKQEAIQEELSRHSNQNSQENDKSIDSYIENRPKSQTLSKEKLKNTIRNVTLSKDTVMKIGSLQKFQSNEITEKTTAKPEREYGSSEQPTFDHPSPDQKGKHESFKRGVQKHLVNSKAQSGNFFAYKTSNENNFSKKLSSDHILSTSILYDHQKIFKPSKNSSDYVSAQMKADKNKELRSVPKVPNKEREEYSSECLSLKKQINSSVFDKDCLYSPSINLDSDKDYKKDFEMYVMSQVKSRPTPDQSQSSNWRLKNVPGLGHTSMVVQSHTSNGNLKDDQKFGSNNTGKKSSNTSLREPKNQDLKLLVPSVSLLNKINASSQLVKSSRNPPLKMKRSSKNSFTHTSNEEMPINSNLYEGFQPALTPEGQTDDQFDDQLQDSPLKQIKKTKAVARLELLTSPKIPSQPLTNPSIRPKGQTQSSIGTQNLQSHVKCSSNSYLGGVTSGAQWYSRKHSTSNTNSMTKTSNSSLNLYPNK